MERAFLIKFTEEIKDIVHEFHGILYNFLMQIIRYIICHNRSLDLEYQSSICQLFVNVSKMRICRLSKDI